MFGLDSLNGNYVVNEDLPLSLIFAFHTVYPFQKEMIEPQRKAKEELMKIKYAKIDSK